ncbi:dihydrofolate reductase family protein [Nocardioides zeae]|uniref:Dihydrofolate reductase family protein n=1 Tax=Nocardioides imazamoxiresistens TaxID=3231893 RepID=A0ABU3Q2R5_9ACTN|nr:dihydrofolate reductase family protein [Nocardioides zeae]MDT9595365.1 dihydrofolate reductase family protein [Nocardioides zeae]
MRVLLDRHHPDGPGGRGVPGGPGADGLSDDELLAAYAAPEAGPWLRVNMVSTLDGAATGDSERSDSIHDEADGRVFAALRSLADVIVVGAGTAEAEGYGPAQVPIVLVSRRGQVPARLRGAAPGAVVLATCGAAEGLDEARELLGEDNVWVLGSHSVDLVALREQLVAQGFVRLHAEGGPHLLRDLLASGVADELCATLVPRVVAGDRPRITAGPPVDVPLDLHLLLEEDGTLLGRWLVRR